MTTWRLDDITLSLRTSISQADWTFGNGWPSLLDSIPPLNNPNSANRAPKHTPVVNPPLVLPANKFSPVNGLNTNHILHVYRLPLLHIARWRNNVTSDILQHFANVLELVLDRNDLVLVDVVAELLHSVPHHTLVHNLVLSALGMVLTQTYRKVTDPINPPNHLL
uniref:Uncharacterized protein n=1 Tax=viral metagenome TaxID=1070528 RepID=A0A6C0CXU2_9ZZZZ